MHKKFQTVRPFNSACDLNYNSLAHLIYTRQDDPFSPTAVVTYPIIRLFASCTLLYEVKSKRVHNNLEISRVFQLSIYEIFNRKIHPST